jgi:hypothetical protein
VFVPRVCSPPGRLLCGVDVLELCRGGCEQKRDIGVWHIFPRFAYLAVFCIGRKVQRQVFVNLELVALSIFIFSGFFSDV